MLVINYNQKKNKFFTTLFFFLGFISCSALKAQLREPQLDKRALLQKAKESPTVTYCIKQEQLQNNAMSPWDQQEINEQECVMCHRAYAIGDEITIIKSCGHTAHHACITPELTHCPGHQLEENQADTLRSQSSRIEQRFPENAQRREPIPSEQHPPIKRQNRTKMIEQTATLIGLQGVEEINQLHSLLQNMFGEGLQQIFSEIPRFVIVNNDCNRLYKSTHIMPQKQQLKNFFILSLMDCIKKLLLAFPYVAFLKNSFLNINLTLQQSFPTRITQSSYSQTPTNLENNLRNPLNENSYTQIVTLQSHGTVLSSGTTESTPLNVIYQSIVFYFAFIIFYDFLITYVSVNYYAINDTPFVEKIKNYGSSIATIGSHVKNKAQGFYSWITGRAQNTPEAQPITHNNITGSNIIEQIRARFNRNQQRPASRSLSSNVSDQEHTRRRKALAAFLKSLFAGVAIKAGAPLFPLIAGFYSSHSAPWNVLIDTMFASYVSTIPGATLLYAAGRTAVEYYKQSGINYLNQLLQN